VEHQITIHVGNSTLALSIQTRDVATHSFFSEHPRFLMDAGMLVQAALEKDLANFNNKSTVGGVDAHFHSR
jgi:hypothetical protein